MTERVLCLSPKNVIRLAILSLKMNRKVNSSNPNQPSLEKDSNVVSGSLIFCYILPLIHKRNIPCQAGKLRSFHRASFE